MASWVVRSASDGAVRVRALAGDIVLCSWVRLSQCLSTQVYKWVTIKLNAAGNPAMDKHPIQRGVEILLVSETGISSPPGGPLGSYADVSSLSSSVFR